MTERGRNLSVFGLARAEALAWNQDADARPLDSAALTLRGARAPARGPAAAVDRHERWQLLLCSALRGVVGLESRRG
jgi:hypothetical protein